MTSLCWILTHYIIMEPCRGVYTHPSPCDRPGSSPGCVGPSCASGGWGTWPHSRRRWAPPRSAYPGTSRSWPRWTAQQLQHTHTQVEQVINRWYTCENNHLSGGDSAFCQPEETLVTKAQLKQTIHLHCSLNAYKQCLHWCYLCTHIYRQMVHVRRRSYKKVEIIAHWHHNRLLIIMFQNLSTQCILKIYMLQAMLIFLLCFLYF